MRRALAVVFVLAALVAAFTWGLDRGITLGIEEALKINPPAFSIECSVPWRA